MSTKCCGTLAAQADLDPSKGQDNIQEIIAKDFLESDEYPRMIKMMIEYMEDAAKKLEKLDADSESSTTNDFKKEPETPTLELRKIDAWTDIYMTPYVEDTNITVKFESKCPWDKFEEATKNIILQVDI